MKKQTKIAFIAAIGLAMMQNIYFGFSILNSFVALILSFSIIYGIMKIWGKKEVLIEDLKIAKETKKEKDKLRRFAYKVTGIKAEKARLQGKAERRIEVAKAGNETLKSELRELGKHFGNWMDNAGKNWHEYAKIDQDKWKNN